MKFLNKTNIYKKEDYIGLNNVLATMRKTEFSFKTIETNLLENFMQKIIDQIQNFSLVISQNPKA